MRQNEKKDLLRTGFGPVSRSVHAILDTSLLAYHSSFFSSNFLDQYIDQENCLKKKMNDMQEEKYLI